MSVDPRTEGQRQADRERMQAWLDSPEAAPYLASIRRIQAEKREPIERWENEGGR